VHLLDVDRRLLLVAIRTGGTDLMVMVIAIMMVMVKVMVMVVAS
jgi:hypothetical protein